MLKQLVFGQTLFFILQKKKREAFEEAEKEGKEIQGDMIYLQARYLDTVIDICVSSPSCVTLTCNSSEGTKMLGHVLACLVGLLTVEG